LQRIPDSTLSRCSNRTMTMTMAVDDATLARLHSVYDGLSLVQRHHLKVIVESKAEVLSVTLCRTLADLGLVRSDGDSFSATEDGRYVASLY